MLLSASKGTALLEPATHGRVCAIGSHLAARHQCSAVQCSAAACAGPLCCPPRCLIWPRRRRQCPPAYVHVQPQRRSPCPLILSAVPLGELVLQYHFHSPALGPVQPLVPAGAAAAGSGLCRPAAARAGPLPLRSFAVEPHPLLLLLLLPATEALLMAWTVAWEGLTISGCHGTRCGCLPDLHIRSYAAACACWGSSYGEDKRTTPPPLTWNLPACAVPPWSPRKGGFRVAPHRRHRSRFCACPGPDATAPAVPAAWHAPPPPPPRLATPLHGSGAACMRHAPCTALPDRSCRTVSGGGARGRDAAHAMRPHLHSRMAP